MTGFVYFLRCGDFVKIGFSAVPDIRLRDLKNSCPYPIDVLGVHAGSRRLERGLHYHFRALRHDGRREWFSVNEEILDVARGNIPACVVDRILTHTVEDGDAWRLLRSAPSQGAAA